MRTIERGHAFTREAVEVVSSVQLSEAAGELDSVSNYSNNDYLHSGLLTFTNVFQNSTDSYLRLDYVKIWIYDTGLFKPTTTLYLFNEPSTYATTNQPTVNNAFNLVSGFTRANLLGYKGHIYTLSNANYVDIKIGANTYDALGVWDINKAKYFRCKEGDTNLYGFLLYSGSGSEKFSANATLDISLGLTHC